MGAPPEPDWKALASAEAALLENPVLDRFEQYRMAVRQLLREGLKRRRSLRETYRSPRGRFQVMVAVAGVDQELEALRQLLLQGSPAMALMERFDAIRGLLLDVWM
ncbi:MAG: YaaR family protein [Firmicutes bacterium]|nr:YaaR family protein [Bacillota bacterium]